VVLLINVNVGPARGPASCSVVMTLYRDSLIVDGLGGSLGTAPPVYVEALGAARHRVQIAQCHVIATVTPNPTSEIKGRKHQCAYACTSANLTSATFWITRHIVYSLPDFISS